MVRFFDSAALSIQPKMWFSKYFFILYLLWPIGLYIVKLLQNNYEVPLLQTVVFLRHFRIKKALSNSYTVYEFYKQRMIALPRKRLAFSTCQQLSKENVPWLIQHGRRIKITNKTSIINPEANGDSPAI